MLIKQKHKKKKQMTTTKKIKRAEDLNFEETERMKRSLIKNAKEVKIKNSILFGKEANKIKPRGREIKGGINWRLNPKDPLRVG